MPTSRKPTVPGSILPQRFQALLLGVLGFACFVWLVHSASSAPGYAVRTALATTLCILGLIGLSRMRGDHEAEREARTHAFMQRVIDAMPEPVFVKDKDARLILVNEAYLTQRKRIRSDVISKKASDLAKDKHFGSFIMNEDARVLDGESIYKEECIRHPVTNEPLYQIVTKRRIIDDDGRPFIVGTFFDVSKQRVAEKDAREALAIQSRTKDFLDLVFNATPNPLFVKNAAHQYIMANRAEIEYEGVLAADIIGSDARKLLGEEIGAGIEEAEFELLKQPIGTLAESEQTTTGHDGKTRHTLMRKIVGLDPAGEPVIIGALTDITSLRVAELRWKFALEGAGDGLWDWDFTSGKVFYSPRWITMQGFEQNEISDSPDERMRRMHTDDRTVATAALQQHLDGEVPIYVCELRQRARNDDWIWILERGQIVERAADGKPLRMIGTYSDITKLKQAEEELRAHRDRLRELVEEQTADLVRAKEIAEAASAAKSQFLTNMSHELRTPMHGVLSFAKLGEEKAMGATPEKSQSYFKRIRESGERLMHLLNDLLDLSKLESGNMAMHMQPGNLRRIAEESLGEFEASMHAKKLVAQISDADQDLSLVCDTMRIGQVVRNLLSNAIKFSPEGGCITLAFAKVQDCIHPGQTCVELVVADEGIGIPDSELESVFDKFVQSSKTQTNAGGTGLGLPICREIVNAHRGEIFARARKPRGTEFVVRLPGAATAGIAQHTA